MTDILQEFDGKPNFLITDAAMVLEGNKKIIVNWSVYPIEKVIVNLKLNLLSHGYKLGQ